MVGTHAPLIHCGVLSEELVQFKTDLLCAGSVSNSLYPLPPMFLAVFFFCRFALFQRSAKEGTFTAVSGDDGK